MNGWTCPKCGRVYAPVVTQCISCNSKLANPWPDQPSPYYPWVQPLRPYVTWEGRPDTSAAPDGITS